MGSIERPSRHSAGEDRAYLITKEREAGGSSLEVPASLALDEIIELPSLFQPRGDSLIMWPGKSEDHIATLIKVLKAGNTLDAISVISFGHEWFLVDGHHRLMAYRKVAWAELIPVEVIATSLSGLERVAFAERESTSRNSKNRLNMSEPEKADAAWRAVVVRDDLSKRDTAKLYSVSPSTVANMRKVKLALLEGQLEQSDLEDMGWRRAAWEASRRTTNTDIDGSMIDDAKRRLVARALVSVLKMRVPASLILEVLEDGRAGFTSELEKAIQASKQQQEARDNPKLDI